MLPIALTWVHRSGLHLDGSPPAWQCGMGSGKVLQGVVGGDGGRVGGRQCQLSPPDWMEEHRWGSNSPSPPLSAGMQACRRDWHNPYHPEPQSLYDFGSFISEFRVLHCRRTRLGFIPRSSFSGSTLLLQNHKSNRPSTPSCPVVPTTPYSILDVAKTLQPTFPPTARSWHM